MGQFSLWNSDGGGAFNKKGSSSKGEGSGSGEGQASLGGGSGSGGMGLTGPGGKALGQIMKEYEGILSLLDQAINAATGEAKDYANQAKTQLVAMKEKYSSIASGGMPTGG